MRRRFYLIDRENGGEKRRITLQEIADHFNGAGCGPVHWMPCNVDLNRFRNEMDEIGYDFVIEEFKRSSATAASIGQRLQNAERRLMELKENRPMDGMSERGCRKYMERLFAQQEKVDKLKRELVIATGSDCPKPPRRRAKRRD